MNSVHCRASTSPPPYQDALRLLCLDGGGTRTICQLFMLAEVTHRLAWDLGYLKTTDSATPNLVPAYFFDEIGAGGMGAFVAFLLACGLSAEAAREQYIRAAPRIVHASSINCIRSILGDVIPSSEQMWVGNECVVDSPSRVNIWLPHRTTKHTAEANVSFRKIPADSPLRRKLLPLVAAEMFRELSGQVDTLHYTLPFALSACPNAQDIALLLSLGSGDIPESTRSSRPESASPSWIPSYLSTACSQLSWLLSNSTHQNSTSTPQPNRPALPSTKQTSDERRELNKYLSSSRAFGRTYIRLNPNFSMWTQFRQEYDPTDWESTKFGDHKMLTSNYCSKVDTAALIDTAVAVLQSRLVSTLFLPPVYARTAPSRHDSLQSEDLAYEASGFY